MDVLELDLAITRDGVLVSIGVDSIITDDPAALLAHLGRPQASS